MLLNDATEQEIRKTVEKILGRKEFQQTDQTSPIEEMIQQIWESILEWIRRMFEGKKSERQFQYNPEFNQNVETGLKIVLIVLAAAALFVIIRLVVHRIYLTRKPKKSKIPKAHEYLENPDLAMEKMKELMAQGLFTEALRYLFVAVLLELHRRKILKIEKWKTNRIYMREIASADADLVLKMRELSTLFNACCYGGRTIDEACLNTWLQFYMNEKGQDEKENQKVD